MFFIDAGDEAGDAPVSDTALTDLGVFVQVAFHGDPPGVFHMSLARDVATRIAADFLGLDADSVTAEQVNDVAKELANMICGAVLSRLESRATLRLSTPDLVDGDAAVLPGTVCAVETGSGILTARIAMEKRECSPTAKSAS
ncbi:MAG: CheC, inhibitor of methylation [Candidatus Solibacter sp.]|nr:CheC, inhibitor of methylation [Candidatus Solibacter sp.]